ncbi:MAG: hypothetical protein ACRCRZ_00300 [Metamycoplasmataceae bacterium]
MKGFKKISKEREMEIIGGVNPALITLLIPLGIQTLNSVVGNIKTLFSIKGEFKSGDSLVKWDNSSTKTYNPF